MSLIIEPLRKAMIWLWQLPYHVNIDSTWDDFHLKCQQAIALNDTTQLHILLTSDVESYGLCMEIINVRLFSSVLLLSSFPVFIRL
jgi:hypothetical protein